MIRTARPQNGLDVTLLRFTAAALLRALGFDDGPRTGGFVLWRIALGVRGRSLRGGFENVGHDLVRVRPIAAWRPKTRERQCQIRMVW